MKVIHAQQGSPEWLQHRATHFNASDAPAMLGISPYKTRGQLLKEMATGITPEIDEYTEKLFDDGHRFEALAREIAETIIGRDLFPVVGSDGKFSASFDGLTLFGDTAYEHKSVNQALRDISENGLLDVARLPEIYRVQMEQQCMVSGAEYVLFMASAWSSEGDQIEEHHCWYRPDAELRAKIVAGWAQFEADLASYSPAIEVPAPIGRAPDQLPALNIQVTGMVTASNLAAFKSQAMAVLGGINRDLQTDDDFADAEKTIKWCKGVEDRLDSVKQQVLGQTADIDAVFRTMDDVSAESRRIRLELDKLVSREKESRKAEIVQAGVNAVLSHYSTINECLPANVSLPLPAGIQSEIALAIKGKKSLANMREAVSVSVANAKITASQHSDRVNACLRVAGEFEVNKQLFPDIGSLCIEMTPENLRNLCLARIAQYEQMEAARIEADRERIRKEEAENLARQQLADAVISDICNDEPQAALVQPVEHHPSKVSVAGSTPAGRSIHYVKLGDINSAIAPLSITADGLAQLGFPAVATDRAAKLYRMDDFQAIRLAMMDVIRGTLKTKAA